MPKTFTSSMTELFAKYTEETGDHAPELKSVAAWAINNGHYDVPFESKIRRFCEQMRDVLGKATHSTPTGKTMRTYQSIRRMVANEDGEVQQQHLWADVRDDPLFAVQAYRERHRAARGDARALQADVEAWNECYRPEDVEPIWFDWDFSKMQVDEG